MSRCRHKWKWTPLKIIYDPNDHTIVDYTNAICNKCGKRKWGHGRNPLLGRTDA